MTKKIKKLSRWERARTKQMFDHPAIITDKKRVVWWVAAKRFAVGPLERRIHVEVDYDDGR